MESDQKPTAFFIRVGVWGRIQGKPTRVAEFVGGPWDADPGDIRHRAAMGIGKDDASPHQASITTQPYCEGAELSAAVTIDFDLDMLGGPQSERMRRFADLWRRGLEREFQGGFIAIESEGARGDPAGSWGELSALREKKALRAAAQSPRSEEALSSPRSAPRI